VAITDITSCVPLSKVLLSQIFTKLVTTPYIVVVIFSTKLNTTWMKNFENTGKFSITPSSKGQLLLTDFYEIQNF
jgi:hypothetical protein